MKSIKYKKHTISQVYVRDDIARIIDMSHLTGNFHRELMTEEYIGFLVDNEFGPFKSAKDAKFHIRKTIQEKGQNDG